LEKNEDRKETKIREVYDSYAYRDAGLERQLELAYMSNSPPDLPLPTKNIYKLIPLIGELTG